LNNPNKQLYDRPFIRIASHKQLMEITCARLNDYSIKCDQLILRPVFQNMLRVLALFNLAKHTFYALLALRRRFRHFFRIQAVVG
tara:strand:+ start:883 stop:1137 length:255 start_codon:yes stop_codon:yes gene_type:complete